MLRKLGLGERPNMELNEMRNGLVPSKSWKLKKDGIGWTPGETINASIGQGYMLTSPIQLATMISRLANGNYAIEPTLLKKKNNFLISNNVYGVITFSIVLLVITAVMVAYYTYF